MAAEVPYAREVEAALAQTQCRVIQVQPPAANESAALPGTFECIVTQPIGGRALPTVVVPHGGPHAACLTAWYLSAIPSAPLKRWLTRVSARNGSLCLPISGNNREAFALACCFGVGNNRTSCTTTRTCWI